MVFLGFFPNVNYKDMSPDVSLFLHHVRLLSSKLFGMPWLYLSYGTLPFRLVDIFAKFMTEVRPVYLLLSSVARTLEQCWCTSIRYAENALFLQGQNVVGDIF